MTRVRAEQQALLAFQHGEAALHRAALGHPFRLPGREPSLDLHQFAHLVPLVVELGAQAPGFLAFCLWRVGAGGR